MKKKRATRREKPIDRSELDDALLTFSQRAAKKVREFLRTASPGELVSLAQRSSPDLFDTNEIRNRRRDLALDSARLALVGRAVHYWPDLERPRAAIITEVLDEETPPNFLCVLRVLEPCIINNHDAYASWSKTPKKAHWTYLPVTFMKAFK